jgi:MIP family channel proteins
MESPPLNKRLAAEIVGTFGFFFIGFTSIAAGAPGPIGFGFGLFLMIAALGHISGGHFNPAVTVGLTVGGKHPTSEVLQYIVAQVIGGVVAALLAILIYDGIGTFDKSNLVTRPGNGVSSGKALIIELIATLLFVMVISAVATDKNAPWNGIQAPIFIGLFVFTGATVFGPLSGGSFNPAVSLAPAITAGDFGDVWIYLIGPTIGGALGGAAFKWFRQPASPTPHAATRA